MKPFPGYPSVIWLLDCSNKLAINWNNDKDVTAFWHDVIVKFFWRCFVSLTELLVLVSRQCHHCLWSYDNFFYKELTRNPKIENTPIWVLLNVWKLGQIRDTKFGTKFSNKISLNTVKYQGYSFYRFWIINRWVVN